VLGHLRLQGEIAELAQVVADHYGQHRDAEIHTSQPGFGTILAARELGDFGDDSERFASAKARKLRRPQPDHSGIRNPQDRPGPLCPQSKDQ
jgi:hypothetical protein